jgi:hypothetical protein
LEEVHVKECDANTSLLAKLEECKVRKGPPTLTFNMRTST